MSDSGAHPAEQPDGQPSPLQRRRFLANMWRTGVGLMTAAGAWTAWDLLRPGKVAGFGGTVRSVAPDAVPDNDVLPVPVARGYLTIVDDEVTALYWKCPHLGCRVPWCATSGRFECPCHGSVYSRAGDYISGPAPRGMDSFDIAVVDGIVEIDTSKVTEGRPPGDKILDEPAAGPSCLGGAG